MANFDRALFGARRCGCPLGISFLAIFLSGWAPVPGPTPTSVILASDTIAHAVTRGHNRKLVYDPDSGYYYFFYTDVNNIAKYRSSRDLVHWRPGERFPKWAAGGSSSMDILLDGAKRRIFYTYLGLPNGIRTQPVRFVVGTLRIVGDGSLEPGTEADLYDGSQIQYGSLAADTSGRLWYCGRLEQQPELKPRWIRNTLPGAYQAGWTEPADLLRGKKTGQSVATRVHTLANDRMGVTSWLEAVGSHGGGQVYFQLFDGSSWQDEFPVGSETANDNASVDLRPCSAVDSGGTIHVLVPALNGPDDRPNRGAYRQIEHVTISPPYTQATVVSAGILPAPVALMSVQIKIDRRSTPNRMYCTYITRVSAEASAVQLIRHDGRAWERTTTTILSDGVRWGYQSSGDTGRDDKGLLLIQENRFTEGKVALVDYTGLLLP